MLRRSLLLLSLLTATTGAEDLASELLVLPAPRRDWRSHPVVRRHAKAAAPAPDAPFSDLYLHWYGLDGLIPSGDPGVLWATLRGTDIRPDWSTWVGRYDLRTFSFEPVLDFPHMAFGMGEIAIDRKAGRLYLRYEGHLLRLPLPTR